ncbi:hypothetical protein BC833DRAFT_563672 [Globomyces pollinis-pini]|nr:hypothetical protein BC833DRAFT_563672 [Globomyces pollinis-pini]
MFFKVTLYILSIGSIAGQLTGLNNIAVTKQNAFCAASGAGEATGQQQANGGQMCSSTVQGVIPDVNNMVSTMIQEPASGATLNGAQGFQVKFSSINLNSGFGLNAQNQFLLAPQTIGANGKIEGLQQLVIQKINNPNAAPAAAQVSFFQAVNQKSNNNGVGNFNVNVPAGAVKTKGLHRICTMAAAAAMQPVVMPIAQRGAQDDCIRVNIN